MTNNIVEVNNITVSFIVRGGNLLLFERGGGMMNVVNDVSFAVREGDFRVAFLVFEHDGAANFAPAVSVDKSIGTVFLPAVQGEHADGGFR